MIILLLGEASSNLGILQEVVQGTENEVIIFTRPEEALSFLAHHADQIEVVLTEVGSPPIDGIQFIQAARELPGSAYVPIVVYADLDQQPLRVEAFMAGATDFLAGLADPGEVRTKILDVIALGRARHAR